MWNLEEEDFYFCRITLSNCFIPPWKKMEIIFETDFIAPWEVAVRRLESQELTQGVPPLPVNNYHLTSSSSPSSLSTPSSFSSPMQSSSSPPDIEIVNAVTVIIVITISVIAIGDPIQPIPYTNSTTVLHPSMTCYCRHHPHSNPIVILIVIL